MTEIVRDKYISLDGSTVESHYKAKRLHHDTDAAWTLQTPGGLVIKFYFQEGVLGRANGPAITVQHPDGSGSEEYFVDGHKVGPRDNRNLRPTSGQSRDPSPD